MSLRINQLIGFGVFLTRINNYGVAILESGSANDVSTVNVPNPHLSINAGVLTLNGNVVSLLIKQIVKPTVGSLAIVGKQANPYLGTVTPITGSLLLVGKQANPYLSRMTLLVGSLILTGKLATVVVTLKSIITPTVGSLTVTGQAGTANVTSSTFPLVGWGDNTIGPLNNGSGAYFPHTIN